MYAVSPAASVSTGRIMYRRFSAGFSSNGV
jgi:hypothetical protein